MNITLMLITAVSERSECCQGRVAVIQCVTDVFRVCLQSSSRTPNSYRRDCFLQFVRREESNPSSMNDSKETLFVSNVVGAISAIPSCPSLHLPSLLPSQFTFTYTPWNTNVQDPHYPRTRTSFWAAVAGTYGLTPEQEYQHLRKSNTLLSSSSASYVAYKQAVPSFPPVYFCMHIGRFRARVATSFLTPLVFHRVYTKTPPRLVQSWFQYRRWDGLSRFPGRKELVSS